MLVLNPSNPRVISAIVKNSCRYEELDDNQYRYYNTIEVYAACKNNFVIHACRHGLLTVE